jgi:ABC-type transporter Mla subunit MlaD
MRLPSVPGPRDVLALVERGGEALEQLLAAVPRLGALLDDAERLLAEVDALVQRIETTRQDADTVVARVEEPVRRTDALLAALEPSLVKLQPTLERLADTTDPREVDALVGLVDHLPLLVERLERDVLPVMTTLRTVAPDLHDLLDVSRELNGMLAKLPGMAKVMQRIDDRQARQTGGT